MTLGFAEELVAEALKQTENQQEGALNLLMNSPQLLMMALHSDPTTPAYTPTEQDILSVVSMGFTPEQAYGTLKKSRGNVQSAVDLLLEGKGVEEAVPQAPTQNPTEPPAPKPDASGSGGAPILNEQNIPMDTSKDEEIARKHEEDQKNAAAEEELVQHHTEDDDVAHLAIDLTEEHNLLAQYKALIMSTNTQ